MNTRSITMKGNPITVSGREVRVGDVLPDFKLTANDMSDLDINAFQNKVVIISCVPSLDTPVCSVQTKRFNEEACNLSDDIAVLTVSRDLPFAQKRWCAAEGAERVVTASDYKYRVFGEAFGVNIESLGLLARAVFVADKEGKIAYAEYVPEVTEEPNYSAALEAAKGLVKS